MKKTKKKTDPEAFKAQLRLLAKIIWEQKCYLFMAFPFMFTGGITDFLFPNLIAQVVDCMKLGDKEGVYYNL